MHSARSLGPLSLTPRSPLAVCVCVCVCVFVCVCVQGGLGDAGYHPVPSARPAKLNCSGVAVPEGRDAIADIAYWKVGLRVGWLVGWLI